MHVEQAERGKHLVDTIRGVRLAAPIGELHHASSLRVWWRSKTPCPFRYYNRGQCFDRVIKNIVNQDVAILTVVLDLTSGLGQPSGDFLLQQTAFLAAAFAQTLGQDVRRGGEEK